MSTQNAVFDCNVLYLYNVLFSSLVARQFTLGDHPITDLIVNTHLPRNPPIGLLQLNLGLVIYQFQHFLNLKMVNGLKHLIILLIKVSKCPVIESVGVLHVCMCTSPR